MKRSFVCAVVLAAASAANAAPNVAQTAQKGSLLVFPDIDVRPSRTTIVRLQNDQNFPVDVRCLQMDGDKNRNDFEFRLTKSQPVWWDAASGAGTNAANPFPDGTGAGLLVCFAAEPDRGWPIQWNHLSGTATVVDFETGAAYEYNAWSFHGQSVFGEGQPMSILTPEVLRLWGKLPFIGKAGNYDLCPRQLIGQFSPPDTEFDTEAGTATIGRTRLVLASCTLDLRQNYKRYDTKYKFDVWNENELKLTGAHDCADGWHETYLTNVLAEGDNFTRSNLKTDAARYRVESVADSSVCPVPKEPPYTGSNAVGILGVQATEISLVGGSAIAGTTLTVAGTRAGFLLAEFNLDKDPRPEGAIR
jgi:hypothetical protein